MCLRSLPSVIPSKLPRRLHPRSRFGWHSLAGGSYLRSGPIAVVSLEFSAWPLEESRWVLAASSLLCVRPELGLQCQVVLAQSGTGTEVQRSPVLVKLPLLLRCSLHLVLPFCLPEPTSHLGGSDHFFCSPRHNEPLSVKEELSGNWGRASCDGTTWPQSAATLVKIMAFLYYSQQMLFSLLFLLSHTSFSGS